MQLRKRKDQELEETDSVSDFEEERPVKILTRKPADNAFRQQRLKAYHPIITPKTVIPLLLAFAIIFVPLGAAMFYGSNKVEEMTLEYTQCEKMASDSFSDVPSQYYTWHFNTNVNYQPQWRLTSNSSEPDPVENKICQLRFQIPNDIGGPVYFFYQLDKFYPNHRRFAKSFSEDQLNGMAASLSDVKDTVGINCQPMTTDDNGKIYYPCGLIANSLFNDTYTTPAGIDGTEDYEMTQKGIAWSHDKDRLKKTKYDASQIAPPPNWVKRYPDGYTNDNIPDISKWSEFQNWMHPAGLSKFSNLYYRNDDLPMKQGKYQVDVGLHWPVLPFEGQKSVYISTRSVIGGKNPFLGIAWIAAGGLCFVLAIVFLVIHLVVPRKTGDVSLLSWNKEKQHTE